VIADRTAYDVRYTRKLSNWFRLQVYERLVRNDPIQQVELGMHPNSIHSTVTDEVSE